MVLTRELWIETLRSYKGTRFRHQGRRKGGRNGVDCIGLLVCAARDLGISQGAEKINDYKREPVRADFDKWASKFAKQLPYNRLHPLNHQVLPGDIVTFWIDAEGVPRHIAVYTGKDDQGRETMIHSYAKERRGVVEMAIDPNYWTRRVSALFRLHEFCEEE